MVDLLKSCHFIIICKRQAETLQPAPAWCHVEVTMLGTHRCYWCRLSKYQTILLFTLIWIFFQGLVTRAGTSNSRLSSFRAVYSLKLLPVNVPNGFSGMYRMNFGGIWDWEEAVECETSYWQIERFNKYLRHLSKNHFLNLLIIYRYYHAGVHCAPAQWPSTKWSKCSVNTKISESLQLGGRLIILENKYRQQTNILFYCKRTYGGLGGCDDVSRS